MKIAMWSSYFIEKNPEEMVMALAGHGWSFSELSSEHGWMLLERGDPDGTGTRFRKFAENEGIRFPQGHFYLKADIAHPDLAERGKIHDDLKRWCDLFAAMNVKAGVLHPGGKYFLKEGGNREELVELNSEPLRRLLEHVKGGPVRICLENMREVFPTAAGLRKLLSHFDSHQLGVCLDTGHLKMTGGDCANFVRNMGDDLKALHVTDSIGERDDHILPYGPGNVDWKGLVEALREINYRGLFNFEIPGERRCPKHIKLAKLDYALKIGELMLGPDVF